MVGNEKGKENILFFFYDDSGYVDQLGHAAPGEEKAGTALYVRNVTIFRFFLPAGEFAEADVGAVPVGDG